MGGVVDEMFLAFQAFVCFKPLRRSRSRSGGGAVASESREAIETMEKKLEEAGMTLPAEC